VRESKRYLGLELAGAKNQKTAVASLELYPREKKLFLLDIFDKVATEKGQSADDALLALIKELEPPAGGYAKLAVNVPLEFPPCTTCTRKTCSHGTRCPVPAVKWMNETCRKAQRAGDVKVLEFTPYTQRPVELWVRYQVMPKLPPLLRFEIDETLGGNRAPLTARMNYLKRHLGGHELCEAWPKLTVAILADQLGLDRKLVQVYRHLEQGIHARETILEALTEKKGVFIYERDIRKLSQSLTCFDAFVCAYTALLADNEQTANPPSGFPRASGWVEYPRL
jgi:hypothetical protein